MGIIIHREMNVVGFGGDSHGTISIELDDQEMHNIFRTVQKDFWREDVKNRLAEMQAEGWVHLTEATDGLPLCYNMIVSAAVALVEKKQDCNTAYNDTLEWAIKEAVKCSDPEALR